MIKQPSDHQPQMQAKMAKARPADISLYYDGNDDLPEDLPSIDEIQYAYLDFEDEYQILGMLGGDGVFTGVVSAGNLASVVGLVLANAIAQGKGEVVEDDFWEKDDTPFRSLPVHERELNQIDQDWLRAMGIGEKVASAPRRRASLPPAPKPQDRTPVSQSRTLKSRQGCAD